MNWVAIGVALASFGVAVYIVSDPISRSGVWTSGDEWEENPEKARQKHYRWTYIYAAVITLLGLVFLLIGFSA
ncbi:hypothetical protein [Halobellus salinisoli]|uniref:hypothetical protein n=1 Tax=Halobellus salinisoli TaxID=3108500 RepID=UPI003008100E